jgi:hypothetical protein
MSDHMTQAERAAWAAAVSITDAPVEVRLHTGGLTRRPGETEEAALERLNALAQMTLAADAIKAGNLHDAERRLRNALHAVVCAAADAAPEWEPGRSYGPGETFRIPARPEGASDTWGDL